MATLKDTSALSSLNEQEYLNKLYEDKSQTQKETLTGNYNANLGALGAAQGSIQQQTAENINRTNVEADKATAQYQQEQIPKLSGGASAQAALSSGNQRQKNVTELNDRKAAAEAEIERQRILEGEQFAAAIKQAQANNDRELAQALYDAAKAEDAQWLNLKMNAATFLQGKGDNSGMEALLAGTAVPENAVGQGQTWEQVRRYEDDINAIYDAQRQAELAQLEGAYAERLSDIEAARREQTEKTDRELTETYVDALRGQRNEAEIQNAYGRGSGTAAQARLARDNELRQDLTDLRLVQADANAGYGMDAVEAGRDFRGKIADAEQAREKARADALIGAAEQEEANLLAIQQQAAEQAMRSGDYSILGAMYGLTPEQMAAIALRPVYGGGYYGPAGPRDEDDNVAIDTTRNQNGLKGSAWDYTLHNLERLVATGQHGVAKDYMGMVAGQMSEKQYETAISVLNKK